MSEYSKKINEYFVEEIRRFKEDPPPACDEKTALKILAEYWRDSVKFADKFWPDPVAKYLPAVVQGTMFLEQENYSHNETLEIAKKRAEALSYNDVANAFIYGVSRGIPAYRTALPAYLHIKAIPDHGEEFINNPDGPHSSCTHCSFKKSSYETEPKMSFLWINSMQHHRIFLGGYLGSQTPQASSFLLREFAKMPPVKATKDDYAVFIKSLKSTERLLPDEKISAYGKLLKASNLIPLKMKEMQPYLDILGYLDILHTEQYHGVTKKFISIKDMPDPVESRSYYAYPVNFWKASDGVDWNRVEELFGDHII